MKNNVPPNCRMFEKFWHWAVGRLYRFARALGIKKVPYTHSVQVSKHEYVALSSAALAWLLSIERNSNNDYVIPFSKKESVTISRTALEWFLSDKT